jgi:hypothetical protein
MRCHVMRMTRWPAICSAASRRRSDSNFARVPWNW